MAPSVATGATPVPVRAIVCGLPGKLSLTTTDPFLTPVAVGLKVTVTVQFAAGARVAGLTGQLFVWLKSPLVDTLTVLAAARLLLTLTISAELLDPTSWLPKFKLEGETAIGGGVWFKRMVINSSPLSTSRASGAPSPLKSPTAVTPENPLTR